MARTKVKTLYMVKVAYFTDHHPDHQGWDGKGWYWYVDAKGCDELYGPYDNQSDAVEIALLDAGRIAGDALGGVDTETKNGPASVYKD